MGKTRTTSPSCNSNLPFSSWLDSTSSTMLLECASSRSTCTRRVEAAGEKSPAMRMAESSVFSSDNS